MTARIFGSGERITAYEVDDTELAAGSTLGSPKGAITIKASGAIEKFYSSDLGATLLSGISIQFWDGPTGAARAKVDGRFRIHPDNQVYSYRIDDGVTVSETIFVLNDTFAPDRIAALTAYILVEIRNESRQKREFDSLFGAQLRGDTERDVRAVHDAKLGAIVAWNESAPQQGRALGPSVVTARYTVTSDHGKVNAPRFEPLHENRVHHGIAEPIALFHHRLRLEPGARRHIWFTMVGSPEGARGARKAFADAPPALRAQAATRKHFESVLSRSVVITPDAHVNRGVLWAKANMLRTQLLAPTGWGFVNDPTRSNNSVGRDTAAFSLGSDYVTPDFSRESIRWYLDHAQRSGKCVEYFDIRNGKSEDYGLNVNDDTPLIVMALAHHYRATGNAEFLREMYPKARKAANYLLSQRDERGLIWSTATGMWEQGIVGWRNIIDNYRISGASTEINSETYAALAAMAAMADSLGKKKDALLFAREATALRDAINRHLIDPKTGLYYLNIDVDGTPRTNVTCDMLFPVVLGVADHPTAARIISRLSVPSFWTEAGIRTVPRDDIEYSPTRSWGLLGGVWVGVTFLYALAAARFNPGFMAYALGTSFQHYSKDPGRNNTVPGQFSEWLHGETLANQGMMLSPWYPPRYVWAAIEGAGGLNLGGSRLACSPRLPPLWKWLGVRNLPFRDEYLTWFVARLPEPTLYANFECESELKIRRYGLDVSPMLRLGDDVTEIALRRGGNIAILIGNTALRTITTPLRFVRPLRGRYHVRYFTSMLGEWAERKDVAAAELERGFAIEIEALGFSVVELSRV